MTCLGQMMERGEWEFTFWNGINSSPLIEPIILLLYIFECIPTRYYPEALFTSLNNLLATNAPQSK